MRLPFGLDLKTIVITVIFMIFVLPLVQGWFASRRASS